MTRKDEMRTTMTPSSPGMLLPERIGKTPLLRLEQVVRGLEGITLLGKAEWTNPGGSVKDRAAAAMVRDAQQRGLLVPGKTILDATSGNTGIALAMLGAALHIPVQLAMPSNVSPERKRILRAYGAEVDWTDADQGSDGAIRRARELAGNDPAPFLLPGSILERRQLAGALSRHRPGDSGPDGGPGDALCSRAWARPGLLWARRGG